MPLLLSSQSLRANNYSSVRKKNLNEQNFDGQANWSGVVNFHCMQMSLVMSVRFLFGDDRLN